MHPPPAMHLPHTYHFQSSLDTRCDTWSLTVSLDRQSKGIKKSNPNITARWLNRPLWPAREYPSISGNAKAADQPHGDTRSSMWRELHQQREPGNRAADTATPHRASARHLNTLKRQEIGLGKCCPAKLGAPTARRTSNVQHRVGRLAWRGVSRRS